MTPRTTVAIVGAGPTGLALACGLRAAGVPVRVLDRAEGPATTSRALGLQPRGVEVLDRLGALGDLRDRAIGVKQVSVHINGRHAATLRLDGVTDLVTGPGLIVSQAEIEAELRGRLGELGGGVEWGAEVAGAHQDAYGVTVALASGEPVRASWLVGCDGARSVVRRIAGIRFPGVPLVERFLLADVHADLPFPRDAVSVWLRGEDLIGVFPLPGEDLWRLMGPAPEEETGDDIVAVLAAMLEAHSGLPASSVRGAVWTSAFRFHRRLVERYRYGRVLLAGDAAHIHAPFGGQGMNTGLGDGENLAWKLALVATGRAQPSLLDSYEAERRPIATEVLSSTSALTRLVLGANPAARLLRDRVLVPMMNRPAAQRRIWEAASQLKVSYRAGPFGGRRALRRGPHRGDRVPDVRCTREDGTVTRLHGELGGRWALLVPSTADGSAYAEIARKHLGDDAVTVLAPTGGSTRDILLVRPDAHLGWGGPGRAADLDDWLTGLSSS
jgi:4,5-epoxidase